MLISYVDLLITTIINNKKCSHHWMSWRKSVKNLMGISSESFKNCECIYTRLRVKYWITNKSIFLYLTLCVNLNEIWIWNWNFFFFKEFFFCFVKLCKIMKILLCNWKKNVSKADGYYFTLYCCFGWIVNSFVARHLVALHIKSKKALYELHNCKHIDWQLYFSQLHFTLF